jgi:hypothetical protein
MRALFKNRLAWYTSELQWNLYHASRFLKNVLIFQEKGGVDAFENGPSFICTGTVYFIEALLIHVLLPRGTSASRSCNTKFSTGACIGVCVIKKVESTKFSRSNLTRRLMRSVPMARAQVPKTYV